MKPHPKSLHKESFQITQTLPKGFAARVLRGADISLGTSHAGTVTTQTIQQDLFSIHFNFFEFLKHIKLQGNTSSGPLTSFLALKNNIQYFIKGLGTLHLKEGQFALLRGSDHEITASFEKGKPYESITITWSEDLVRQALPHFDALRQLFDNDAPTTPAYIGTPGHYAGTKALDLVQEILKSPYNKEISLLYFEHKVREYLLLLLVELTKIPVSRVRLSEQEWERITELAAMLSREPNKKFPISKLAITSQMNSMKLKMAFKEKYGQGIFEYQLAARMKEALRLLKETTSSTKEIAAIVGYQHTTSFITKFTAHFGYPPSTVKRNK